MAAKRKMPVAEPLQGVPVSSSQVWYLREFEAMGSFEARKAVDALTTKRPRGRVVRRSAKAVA